MGVCIVEDGTIGYLQGWFLWWQGNKLEDCALWGQSMIFWGRIGKLLQVAGGLVVVLDLIGPERFARASRLFREVSRLMHPRIHKSERTNKKGRLGVLLVWLYMCFVVFIVVPVILVWADSRGDISAVLSLILIFALIGLSYRGDLLLRMLNYLIRAGKHGYAAQWLAVFLIVIGFHLDLLAS